MDLERDTRGDEKSAHEDVDREAHPRSFGELMDDTAADDESPRRFEQTAPAEPYGFSGVGLAGVRGVAAADTSRPRVDVRAASGSIGLGRVARRLGVNRDQLAACVADVGLAGTPVKGSCRVYTKAQVDQIVSACASNYALGA